MKIQAQTGTIKIWFGLLKLAIAQGLPINEQFYESWGTRDELVKLSFNAWWKVKGRALFEAAMPKVMIVEATDEFVTVKVPTSLTAVEVKRQVSQLVTKQRGSKRLKTKGPLAFDGDVKYRSLKQYERYLAVEFDPRNAGKTIQQKTELLRSVYKRIRERVDKQTATLRKMNKKDRLGQPVSGRFKARDPDSFGPGGLDAKKVSRWRLSGKILLLNVAEGSFPGREYYGPQLADKLKARLKDIGLPDIGSVVRNRGGGKLKAERTGVRVRKSKREAAIGSLRAYGSGRNPNRWGRADV